MTKEVEAVMKLQEYPNIIFASHNSFNTNESVIRKSEQSAQQLAHFFKFKWNC